MGDHPLMGAVPRSARRGRTRFVRARGKHPPVPWFGIRWLTRNATHLLASGLASEDIDARDWMTPDPPAELVERIAAVVGGDAGAATLAEALGRDVWIDFVADTGDDDGVSKSVAQLVSRAYEIPDEETGRRRVVPRGDVLIFGGDTAYPVATAEQIRRRLLEPWNEVLRSRPTAGMRAVLAIPGNHDWNDGLDGFARLFRRPDAMDVEERSEARGRLRLHGYEPVQSASHFALPLAPGLDLWAVDRQLSHLDYRQRQYFRRAQVGREDHGRVLVQADPHRVFCTDNPPGRDVAARLGLDLEADPHLVLSGDIHHYQRWESGATTHVIAGGGGAALHGAASWRGREEPAPVAEFPEPEDCRPLLGEVFGRVASGGAGWFIHAAILILATVAGAAGALVADGAGLMGAGGVLALGALFGGMRAFGRDAFGESLVLGLAIGLPVAAMGYYLPEPLRLLGDVLPVLASSLGAAVLGGTAAAWAIASLTRRGVDHYLGWAALAHPGFKHFLRLRVHADGSAIDVWCFGLANPCAEDDPVLVVDHFTWDPK